MNSPFQVITHTVDLCVLGGGLAGTFAAIAAAREGASVLLMQDRPVLGGNASSEIRMWICGAHGSNMRETGLLEEMQLKNLYHNPDLNYSVQDHVLYEMAQYQPGLTLLLNCSCLACEMDGNRIVSVRGWQGTTQQYHDVKATLFADCTGDSILAPLTGASFRVGREDRSAFGESIAPEVADKKTMGMSCLMQARLLDTPNTFIPPQSASKFTAEDLAPYRIPNMDDPMENFWYIELGGEQNSIDDTEMIRQKLLEDALGIWDYIKNAPENKERNRFWHLDWIGFLPGKRESRRYIGDYTLCEKDIRQQTAFEDIIAYGGWSMDNHHPGGLRTKEPPTIYHPAPSPYGIPYRCLYSSNIVNLMFAGRNISYTHVALSGCRVMATCAIIGQAMGTAAALCIQKGCMPGMLSKADIDELQQTLLRNDCYLPGVHRRSSALMNGAILLGGSDPSALQNGIDRPVDNMDNGCHVELEQAIVLQFPEPRDVRQLRLVFDSDLDRLTMVTPEKGIQRPMLHNRPLHVPAACVPHTLTRAFRIDILHEDGAWETAYTETNNFQRLVFVSIHQKTSAIRFVPLCTWGAADCHLFALDAE